MNISKAKLEQLEHTVKRVKCLSTELANVRKAYEESSARDAQIKDTQRRENLDLVRRLQNVEASNQQLSRVNGDLGTLARELVREKDTMSGALVTMWNRFEELIREYHKLQGRGEKPKA